MGGAFGVQCFRCGNQTFNIHYGAGNEWLAYNVTIDGVSRAQNDGWVLSDDGWLTVTGAKSNVQISFGEREPTAFTSADYFAIPQLNGSIGFASGGTYVFADFNGSMWTFQNLELSQGGSSSYNGYWGLQFSAQNSTETISSFTWNWWNVTPNYGWVNYTVSGVGSQILNPSYDRIGGWPINYTVYIDGQMAPQGTSWNVTTDGWITVSGAASNVSIIGVENVPPGINDMPPPGVPSNEVLQQDNSPVYFVLFLVIVVMVTIPLVFLFKWRKGKQEPQQMS